MILLLVASWLCSVVRPCWLVWVVAPPRQWRRVLHQLIWTLLQCSAKTLKWSVVARKWSIVAGSWALITLSALSMTLVPVVYPMPSQSWWMTPVVVVFSTYAMCRMTSRAWARWKFGVTSRKSVMWWRLSQKTSSVLRRFVSVSVVRLRWSVRPLKSVTWR